MESGIYVILGAIVGGLISFFSAQRASSGGKLEQELARVKKSRDLACQQIKAYHYLETRYAKEVAALMDQPEPKVRNRFRDDVETEIGIRPTWTATDAERAVSELS